MQWIHCMQLHIGYVHINTVWVVHWLMNVVVNIALYCIILYYIALYCIILHYNVKLHAMDPLHASSHWLVYVCILHTYTALT